MSFWNELKRRNVYKVGAAYFLFALAVLAFQANIATPLSLDVGFQRGVLILLAVGMFPVLLLAWLYELTPAGIRRTSDVTRDENYARATNRRLNVILLALLMGALVGWGSNRFWVSDEKWLYEVAIPQLDEHLESSWLLAFELAEEIERRVPGSEELAERLPQFTFRTSIESNPPGARVFRRLYEESGEDWEEIGTTPLVDILMPVAYLSVVRLEMTGYQPLVRVLGPWPYSTPPQPFVMDSPETLPEGMVRVPGWLERNIEEGPVTFGDFFLGRNEVSNREFQEFVADRGYQNPAWWPESITVDGQEIPFGTEEWYALFPDSTDRIGPITWTGGRFPEGDGEYPVTGVSWYEAAAYAAWAGRELPSFVHWRHANHPDQRPWVVPASNIQSNGAHPVDECLCYSFPGVLDMAGNAREWLQSPETDGTHLIAGGGWRDDTWRANFPQLVSSLDRQDFNGFRLAETSDPEPTMARAYSWAPPSLEARDLRGVTAHVDDADYENFESFMGYDPRELNANTEESLDFDGWVRQRVVIDAAYDDFRLPVNLFLPKSAEPPFKAVVMFPAGNYWSTADFEAYNLGFMDYLVQNGFAVALPVYPGSFERKDEMSLEYPGPEQSETYAARDWITKAHHDVRRTVDLLVSMEGTIDAENIGYLGVSSGGEFASINLALEKRLTAAAILLGGLHTRSRFQPLVDPWNYVSRVCQPVLFIAAETDDVHPLETSGKPWYDALCTDVEDKEIEKESIVSFGGHWLPRPAYVGPVLDFFEKHLGEPNRQ